MEHPSVYRSATFDAKFFNFLLACLLFYFTFSPKFRASVNDKIK